MADEAHPERVAFYTADPRAIVPIAPDEPPARLPRSLRALARRAPFRITTDTAFEHVIRACASAARSHEVGTWINEWIVRACTLLHRAGHAHSIEAWLPGDPGRLAGGLYGVHLGGAFFGESMFTLDDPAARGASKVCFAHLVHHLRARGFVLLDSQFMNHHMRLLGAVEVTRDDYLARLDRALAMRADWLPWTSAHQPTPGATGP